MLSARSYRLNGECFAENAIFYGENSVPFVMGTTGGDREKLIEDTKKLNTFAVIAPQMGKQVNV